MKLRPFLRSFHSSLDRINRLKPDHDGSVSSVAPNHADLTIMSDKEEEDEESGHHEFADRVTLKKGHHPIPTYMVNYFFFWGGGGVSDPLCQSSSSAHHFFPIIFWGPPPC
jgi:hypothetical protein